MKIRWPLPPDVEEYVQAVMQPDEKPIVTLATDLVSPDTFGTGWLISTTRRIVVCMPASQMQKAGAAPAARDNAADGSASAGVAPATRLSVAASGPALPLPPADSSPLSARTLAHWHVQEYALGQVLSAQIDPLVGGGRLQLRVGSHLYPIVYFTSSLTERFAEAARTIEKMAKKEEPKVPEEEPAKRCAKCGRLLPEPGGLCPACVHKAAVIMRIVRYIKPYWPSALLLAVIALFSMCARLVPPYLTRLILDRVLVPGRNAHLLIWYSLGLLAMALLEGAAGVIHGWVVAALSARVTRDIRAHIYRVLERLTLRFYDKRQTGAIMSRVTNDADRLNGLLVDGLPYFLSNLILVLGVTVVLFTTDWRLAVCAVIPAPFLLIGGGVFWRRMRNVFYAWGQKWSNFSAYLNESITGIKVVKAFAQETREINRLDSRNDALCAMSTHADRLWMLFFSTMGFMAALGTVLVWFFGGRRVLSGQVTLGELVSFISYQAILYGPLQWFSNLNNWITRALAGAERIFEVIDSEPEPYQTTAGRALPNMRGEVEFKSVVFGYERYKPVLKGIDLHIKPGEMIGLVGRSGVGKSTLINLLCRFYDPDEGVVLLDGVDLRSLSLESLRSNIGMVLQEPFLFNGTIMENIAYAKPDANREEIIRAARAANAHNFILNKPDGYDTQVGERGSKLSVGERQRVSIARAILHNPRILILDEATASVDTETERQIQEAINRLVKGRTTLAIAHRLSTLRNADRLVVVDEGKIVEIGTHDELMEKKGIYHRLVNMQTEINKMRVVEG